MNNQIINIPATTFTSLANHFQGMHPEGIKGAVDVHSPDFYEDAELKTFFTRPGEWEELEEIY